MIEWRGLFSQICQVCGRMIAAREAAVMNPEAARWRWNMRHTGCRGPGGQRVIDPERTEDGRWRSPTVPTQIPQRETPERKPAMTTPPRRARLINGHAVTLTDRGMIVDDLEIEYTPTFEEASREIGTRQRRFMLEGVEAHEALTRALAEVHPVFKRAYTA